ncbi:DUF6705 family protein [Flavobacterium ginsenosidimutans]|uniref:DUF6705 family protein n=1 Tax=Flavobacterium ginsenosidimutans TaxID=687844 RepID=A0ABZ2Q6N5_9FLAO|nr:DUF6705 family protein [Flavobacterium ginsenosidimutans]KAF2333015.1 hypothetical protein DM444_09425 [Flavobacterium ginsenosidimutans]
MKKTIILISLTMIIISCKAQQTIPLEKLIEYRDSQSDIPNGAYLQDVNSLLNKYIGTWKGTNNNKNYTFILTKVKRNIRGVFIDELLIRYLITSTTGTVIEDTRNLTDTDPLVIEGDYISANKKYYVLNYFGRNSKCGQSGEVFISTTSDNQLKLFLATSQDMINGKKCATVAEQILPTKSILLTKQ